MADPLDLIPRYQQIVGWLRGEIASGALAAGWRIPTERELGERFGVARETVRHATAVLRHQGLVEVRRGKGTYVLGHAPATIRLGFGDHATVTGTTTVVRAAGAVERYATNVRIET